MSRTAGENLLRRIAATEKALAESVAARNWAHVRAAADQLVTLDRLLASIPEGSK